MSRQTAHNNALPKVRAGPWNIGCSSASASVSAGRFQFGFCLLICTFAFQFSICTGQDQL